MIRRWLPVVLLIVVALFIVNHPHSAATAFSSLGGTLHTWADNTGTFFADLIT